MSEAVSDLQARLGLAADPFAPGALPGFFFVGGQRRFLAQRVVHALYFSGSAVLLSGPRGAGKSRMLEEVLLELRDLADCCRIDATVMMDGAEVRRAVAATFGLPPSATQDNTGFVAALAHWQPAGREPHPIALLIDDAHLLAVPVLAECLALARSAGGRLRLLLAGEPDLLAASEQAGAEAIERIELPPLDRQETADYVATRLQAAGLRAESPLTAAQLDNLYRLSNGNFGAIHEWLPSLFSAPASAARGKSGETGLPFLKDVPLQHIAIGAGLLLVVVLMILNRGEPPAETKAATESATGASTAKGQDSIALELPKQPVPAAVPPPKPVMPAPAAPAVSAPPVVEAPPKAAAPAPQSVPRISGSQKVALPKTPVPASTPAAPINAPVANAAPAKPAPMPAPLSTPTAQPTAPSSTAAPAPVAPAPAVAATASPAAAATDVAGKTGAQTDDERALLGWSPKEYALQLLGAGSSDAVRKFVQQPHGDAKLYIYRAELNGKPWYIVVTGPFADRNAAMKAADTLPPALRAQKPWPRAMKNIHADIRQRK